MLRERTPLGGWRGAISTSISRAADDRETSGLRVCAEQSDRIASQRRAGYGPNGFTFESVEDGTRLTHPSEIELGGLWKLITPILIPMLERDGQEDMANIKRLIEVSV